MFSTHRILTDYKFNVFSGARRRKAIWIHIIPFLFLFYPTKNRYSVVLHVYLSDIIKTFICNLIITVSLKFYISHNELKIKCQKYISI